jgi:hypothetical protein
MPESTADTQTAVVEEEKPAIDFGSIVAMFSDDEQPAPQCDLENPESCEACQ